MTINLGAQSDGFTITGSGFADTITGSTAADIINAGAGDDTIAGFAGNDVIDGGEGSDRLAGDGGVDVLRGGAGNDTFRGLKLDGNDVYDGGADTDTVDYSATTSGVKIDLTPENRSGQAITGEPTTFAALMLAGGFADATTQVGLATGADTGADVLVSIENAIGGAGADTMFGSAVANTLEGAGGDDKIWARGDDDTIRGGDGNDVLVGGFGGSSGKPSGNDIIFGDAGNDELYGEDGNDVLWGGKGSDQYAGGGGHDVLHFDSDGASDTAWGGAESDTFVFHAGFGIDRIKDLLATGTDSDKIDLSDFSVSFKDLKIAQVGQNTEISGFGGGNKIILEVVNAGAITSVDFVFSRLDREKGTKKNDTISGGSDNDRIKGLGGKDKLKGKGGNDTLDGGGGADKLYGDAGDDNLKGGGGGDKLFGGPGIDTLSGGSGRDSFVFRSPGDGMDSITDFASGNDRLEISATGFGGGLAAKSAATLVTLADIHGYVDGGSKGIFLFDNSGTDLGTIYWDANGGSSADAIAFARISGSSLLETDAGQLFGADNCVRIGVGDHLDAARPDRLFEEISGGRIELALHQGGHEMEDGNAHAAAGQAGSRLKAEETAADHHRAAAAPGGREHLLDIVEIAECDDAGQVPARHRHDERVGAGGNQELVVVGRRAIGRDDAARRAIDWTTRLPLCSVTPCCAYQASSWMTISS